MLRDSRAWCAMSERAQQEAIRQQQQMQRNTELHARNFVADKNRDDPKTLKYLAETDNIPTLSDDTLDYLLHKNISTANLNEAEARAIEWENEIAMLRREQAHPPDFGVTGYLRAYAFQDMDEYKMPIGQEERIKQQGIGMLSKLAATRSEEFIGVDTTTRDIQESIVSNPDESSGGLLRRWTD